MNESKRPQRPQRPAGAYSTGQRSKFIVIKEFSSGKKIFIAEATTRAELIEKIKADSITFNSSI
jgi:ABC-type uncharacterized transport system ATPase subunit